MLEYKLSPSVLAADFSRLGEETETLEEAGAPWVHLDVMDGLFVPSISIGMPVIKSLRKRTKLTFDVHLMIEDPDRYLEEFAEAGADVLTVHAEACCHLDRTVRRIHELGLRAGVALNPATPWESLRWILPELDLVLIMSVNPGFGGQKYIPYSTEKIRELRNHMKKCGCECDIEVDGGVSLQNAEEILHAGANVLVAGAAVFRDDAKNNVKRFLEILERAQRGYLNEEKGQK